MTQLCLTTYNFPSIGLLRIINAPKLQLSFPWQKHYRVFMPFLNLPFFAYSNELIHHSTATLGDSFFFFGKPQTRRWAVFLNPSALPTLYYVRNSLTIITASRRVWKLTKLKESTRLKWRLDKQTKRKELQPREMFIICYSAVLHSNPLWCNSLLKTEISLTSVRIMYGCWYGQHCIMVEGWWNGWENRAARCI